MNEMNAREEKVTWDSDFVQIQLKWNNFNLFHLKMYSIHATHGYMPPSQFNMNLKYTLTFFGLIQIVLFLFILFNIQKCLFMYVFSTQV